MALTGWGRDMGGQSSPVPASPAATALDTNGQPGIFAGPKGWLLDSPATDALRRKAGLSNLTTVLNPAATSDALGGSAVEPTGSGAGPQ